MKAVGRNNNQWKVSPSSMKHIINTNTHTNTKGNPKIQSQNKKITTKPWNQYTKSVRYEKMNKPKNKLGKPWTYQSRKTRKFYGKRRT